MLTICATRNPLVEPAEAFAIGLSITLKGPARWVKPDGAQVRTAMLALHLAGYKIVPR